MVIASETGSLGAGTSSPESRANIPPVVSVQGDSIRATTVAEPLNLETIVTDDGLPEPTDPVEEAVSLSSPVALWLSLLSQKKMSCSGD